jgi:hypothetical protein
MCIGSHGANSIGTQRGGFARSRHRLASHQPTAAPSHRVWLPQTAERALWVTPDGRLVSFELDTRALVDRTNGLEFRTNLDGG